MSCPNYESKPENRIEFGKVLTLPNFLSLSRLFLLPLILFFIATKEEIAGLVLMSISWLTDALDGYIARRTNQVTNLGKILDHLVDKIWVGVILVTLVVVKELPVWIAGAVIIRDLLIVIGASLIIQKKNQIFSSNIIGKITGFFFAILMVSYLLDFSHSFVIRNTLLIVVAILIFASFVNYLYLFIKTLSTQKGKNLND
ncbi:MAG: CDP-alcohol phosphatidyltransferase family protein [candidate division WOR-3 bacterium]|nr:CDP-alcohol phosphatidyltransferase family protein [candidate division WOR-3 bacterium]